MSADDVEDEEERPFRPADNWTPCPQCGVWCGWNDEPDPGLEEQECLACGHEFAGDEPGTVWEVPEDFARGPRPTLVR